MASPPPESSSAPAKATAQSPAAATTAPVETAAAQSPPAAATTAPVETAAASSSSSDAADQAAQDSAPIEVDYSDGDSAYESSILSDTTSLKSSMLKYQWEYGRRYHAETDTNKYWGPNDDKQQEAEDLSHEMHKLILDGRLHEAPLKDPQRVLEAGCGTGAWAIDFADENPGTDVIGIDLSPIQPPFVPPNCRFEIDDMNKEWTFPVDHFDYVHLRSMLGTSPDWTETHKSAFRHIKPGGWVEHVELSTIMRSEDGTVKPGSPLEEWGDLWGEVGDKVGFSFRAAEVAHSAITAAGFTNITERVIKVPIGRWPKDKKLKAWGQWSQYFVLEGLEGFALRSFMDVLGWTYEKAQLFLVEVRKDFTDPNIHVYTELHIVYGQKPPC